MRAGLTILIQFLFILSTSAQETWFKIYDLGFEIELSADVQCFADRILYLSFCSNVGDTATRNELISLDQSGEIQWRSFLRYPQDAWASNVSFRTKGLVVTRDSSVYVYTESFVDEVNITCIINKFDFDGTFLWMKEYAEPNVSVWPSNYGLALARDSLSLVFVGKYNSGTSDEKLIAYRIDTSGQVVSRIILDLEENMIGVRVPVIFDYDDYPVLAYGNRILNDNALQDHFVRIIDFESYEEFTYSNWPQEVGDVGILSSGSLVYLSRQPGGSTGGMRISVLTPTFDSIWSDLYYDHTPPYFFIGSSRPVNLAISSSDKILALGFSGSHASIVCYSAEGTLEWVREIALEGYSQISFSKIAWGLDNSILLTGGLAISDSCTPYSCYRVFIMKLDSTGCLAANCDSTLIISNVSEIANNVTNEVFLLTPNPGRDKVYLKCTSKTPGDCFGARLSIYNGTGLLIREETVQFDTDEIDTSDWAAGVYYFHIATGKQAYVSQFIKQ